MDWQLRIALVVAGCALVGYVYYDYVRKKKIQKENDRLKKQFNGLTDTVDSAGFDYVGVGVPRPAESISEQNPTERIEPIIGTSVQGYIQQSKSPALDQDESILDSSTDKANLTAEQSTDDANLAKDSHAPAEAVSSPVEEVPRPEQAMVLSLILQAAQGTHFKGKDFLPIFLSQGLRHGEMGIFHRRTRSGKEPGPVLFSLANGIAPGVFDINNLENFETPALALFVTLPGPEDAQVAYNAMYKTCKLLQQELGGDLLDETKSVYSKQTHNHRLDQIKDYSFKFGV